MKFKLFICLFAYLLICIFYARPAIAETGISVTPSINHIDLATDSPEYELTYKNNTNTEIALTLSVKDFTQLEDSYKIDYLSGNDAKNYKYSLSSWITFENKNIQLSPHQAKSIKVFIDKDRITKGGHYATILAEIKQPEQKREVNVKAVLASLLFVRASTGQEIEEGKIDSFHPSRDLVEYPDSYILRFQNSGNVHVVPYGMVEVFDPLGNLVGKGILNEDSLDALPESIRRYDIKVSTYQKVLIPGVYTAKISIHFGKTNKNISQIVKFFSQGMFDFVKIGFGLIVIAAIALYFKRHRNTS